VVMLGLGAYHIAYAILTASGRSLIRALRPGGRDFREFGEHLSYLAGRRPKPAAFGRFGYPEKLEYWAVVWGTVIMGLSGLMIWFKLEVTQNLPRWAVDVATTVHYYEAILACFAIVVWHFYHVMFDPGVFPMNWAWFDGKVDAEWYRHEHAGDVPPAAADTKKAAAPSLASGKASPAPEKPPG
jgi:cytochrome b subunit of formate dehydrogenase